MKIINPRYVFPFWIRIPFWIWRKLSIFAGSNGVLCDMQYFVSRLLICVSPFLADFLGRAGWKSTSMMCRNTLLRKTYFQNKCFHSEINLGTSRRTFEKKIESHYECTCERTFLIMETPILFVRLYLNVKFTRCVLIIYNLQYRLINYSRFTRNEN